MAPLPQLQRRYSVTILTPAEDVPQASKQQHSPRLQALDTSVQSKPTCGLCDPGLDAAKNVMHHIEDIRAVAPDGGSRGRKISQRHHHHHTIRRMVSKRSATQLPSPNTPTTHELPPKIARLGLEPQDAHTYGDVDYAVELDEGVFTDPFDEVGSIKSLDYGALRLDIPPSSPFSTPSSRSDDPTIEPLELVSQYDSGVESLALTPIDDTPTSPPRPTPPTFLTLPPEIRRQIYHHLPDLVHSHPLIYCLSTFNNALQHPLGSVSRLVRSEALAIFYSLNTWTIKLEFALMYEAFRDWIIRLGDGAGLLRLVTIAVRGKLFKPRSRSSYATPTGNNAHVALVPGMPPFALAVESYFPPDGDACFSIDLSEKFDGGKVQMLRNEGDSASGVSALIWLEARVRVLWMKRREGTLNGQDWIDFVDALLAFVETKL